MSRVIRSHRIASTGLHQHRCPLTGETIGPDRCRNCPHLGVQGVVFHEASYDVHCHVASEVNHLMKSANASKVVDPRKLPASFDLEKAKATYGWADFKLDGARAILQINTDGPNTVVGRRKNSAGTKREWGTNVPHFRDFDFSPDLDATVLDCEVLMPPKQGSLGATMTVVGSKPPRAIEAQRKYGPAVFYAFDLIFYGGQDLRSLPFSYRQSLLRDTISQLRILGFEHVRQIRGFRVANAAQVDNIFNTAISMGLEGIVLKNLDAKYGELRSMIKFKQQMSWDVLVTGFELGSIGGQYEDVIGTFLLSVVDQDGNLREVGKVIPGDNDTRGYYTDMLGGKEPNEIERLGIIIEVGFQSVTKNYRMRHPRIIRYREDRSEPEVVNFSTLVRR